MAPACGGLLITWLVGTCFVMVPVGFVSGVLVIQTCVLRMVVVL